MNKNKTSQMICIAALILTGFMGSVIADETQSVPATIATSSNQYIGIFYAYAKMTNSSGFFWIVPPPGTKTGTFTDASGFPPPYTSSLLVTRKSDLQSWYTNDTNSITFPATNSSYMLSVYVNSPTPPPANGQPLILQVTWQ